LIQAGKVKALATTAVQRSAALHEVPTLLELGRPELSLRDWHGLVAPAGTPPKTLELAKHGALEKAHYRPAPRAPPAVAA